MYIYKGWSDLNVGFFVSAKKEKVSCKKQSYI